eukprot:CAMPEP_0197676884 /NCGR_PEP_ID=MMETSP1338-20131121/87542_1 /TAXON_ID=43686 ORGANISM="Pelagodinium beii, Strain RCC1491" /NCGR_SAMPLE_ID=MMETSP1338 /ASSEMBLY_ACC=CAM_ASM_000754 /LENGTH=240 /DNA_ID=CAMNT_0043257629 /DNA_START=201 /DNA_END=920 /DNA_ORIENTATION=+
MPKRIPKVKPVLDAIVEGQSRPPDKVFLAVPPETVLPKWLESYNSTSRRPGVLQVLRMASDYGPASKLLAAAAELKDDNAIIIYGDDDIIYGKDVVAEHVKAQELSAVPTAFGTRRINVGGVEFLEATGSISMPLKSVPKEAFKVNNFPATCRLSDDYFIGYYLAKARVPLGLLEKCQYDFGAGTWPSACGIHSVPSIEHIDALSQLAKFDSPEQEHRSQGGDWRTQLHRYEQCGEFINT